MKDKKRYYALDEVGFVGTQVRGSRKTCEKDIHDTVQYIKSKKAAYSRVKLSKQSKTTSKMS